MAKPHDLILTGASVLGAIGSVARIMANPGKVTPKQRKALYRARLQQLLSAGLPGPVASDRARKELGYRSNPLTKDETAKLQRLARTHLERAQGMKDKKEQYYNYGVASGYERVASEYGVRGNPLLATIGNPGKKCKHCERPMVEANHKGRIPKGWTRKSSSTRRADVCWECPKVEDEPSFADMNRYRELGQRTKMGGNPKRKVKAKAKPRTTKTKSKPLPRRKNSPRITQVGKASLDQIKHLPGYEEAYKRFKKFHDSEPSEVIVYEVPDGIDAEKVVLTIGQVPEMHYVTPLKESNKNGYQWVHKTAKGKEPIHLYNPLTDEHILVPPQDGVRVTDWLREHNE